jgi:toxin YoeB
MTDLVIDDQFFADIELLKREDKKLTSKVWDLIADISKHINTPLFGIGKPEALKNDMTGYCSRHITDKHRLIYKVEKSKILLVSCYGHYDDK